jgi:hypothetical protein
MYAFRGLGLSCPGDPGCPGYVAPVPDFVMPSMDCGTCVNGICSQSGNSCAAGPMTPAQDAAAVALALKQQGAVDPSTLTGFLNTYSTWLILGGGALVGFMLLGKGRR